MQDIIPKDPRSARLNGRTWCIYYTPTVQGLGGQTKSFFGFQCLKRLDSTDLYRLNHWAAFVALALMSPCQCETTLAPILCPPHILYLRQE